MITSRMSASLLILLAVCANAAEGQVRRVQSTARAWSVDGEAGVAIPVKHLADYTETGPSVGVEVSYPISPRVSIGVEGDLDWLQGRSVGTSSSIPDLTVWRYAAGLDFDVLPPSAPAWSVIASLALGGTSFTSGDFVVPGDSPEAFDHTYLSPGAGLRVSYQATPRMKVFTRARASMAMMKRGDVGRLAALGAPGELELFSDGWWFPVTAGVNLRM